MTLNSNTSPDAHESEFPTLRPDDETLRRWNTKDILSPEDYIGSVFTDGVSKHKIDSILGEEDEAIVFRARDLDTGKTSAFKIFRSVFNKEATLKERLNEAVKQISNNPDRVIQICNQLLEIESTKEIAAFNKAIALRVKGNLDESLEWFDLAIASEPHDHFNLLEKAVVLSRLDRHREAIEVFLSATSVNPDGTKLALQKVDYYKEAIESSTSNILKQNDRDMKAIRALEELSKPRTEQSRLFVSAESKINSVFSVPPFFHKDEAFNLGEIYCSPSTFPYFKIGENIALMHSHGLIDFDRTPENTIIDNWGNVRFLDPMIYEPAERLGLTPETAALALEPPFLTFKSVDFHAILSGYISHAVTFIEPDQCGFTSKLLSLLGGKFPSIPSIRTKILDMQELTSHLGITWEINSENQISFEIPIKDNLQSFWEVKPANALCLAAYQVLSGIEPSQLLIADRSTLSPATRRLYDIFQQYTTEDLTNSSLDLEPIMSFGAKAAFASIMLHQLATLYGYPRPSSDHEFHIQPNLQPDFLARSFFIQTLSHLPIDVSQDFFDGLVDFTNFVTYLLDTHLSAQLPHKHSILEFAQSAFMLLQYSVYGPDLDEQQERRILQDYSGLTWLKSKGDEVDTLSIHRIALYKTQGETYTSLFSRSVEAKHVRWSYIWKALEFRRLAIKLAIKQVFDPQCSTNEIALSGELLPALIIELNHTLQEYAKAALETRDGFHARFWVEDSSPYKAELKWTTVTLEFNKNNSLLSKRGRKQLQDYLDLHNQ